jgi:hypothetical protein
MKTKVSKIKRIFTKKKNRVLIIYSTLILFLILLIIIFRSKLSSFVMTIVLLFLGTMSGQIKRMTGNIHIGIGFVPFANIMFLQSHGIAFTLVASLVMMLSSSIFVGEIRPHIFVTYFIFAGVAFLSFFINLPIFAKSMTLLLTYNIVGFFIMTSLGFNITKNLIYSIGSTFFNYFLFKYFGEIVLGLLV